MEESTFDRDLKIVRKFGEEKINGKSFKEYLKGEEDYFKIIETFFAAMLPWKKDYNKNQLKENATFYFRRFKGKQRRKEPRKEVKKNCVVFFPISESNVIFFEPLINELLKNQDVVVLRFDYSLDGLKKELKKRNLPYSNFEHYLTKETDRKVKGISKKYRKTLKISRKIIKRNRKYKRLEPVLKYFFGKRQRFYELLEFIEGFKKFIKEVNPSMFIIPGETMDLERAAAYLCKKKGIPCIFPQDGNVIFESQESPEIISTKKVVFGEAARDLLIKKGGPKGKIYIAGSPLYDKLISKKISESNIKAIKKKLGIENKKILLFASTTNLKVAESRLKALFDIIKRNPELAIIIKQHPGEYRIKKYEKFYKNLAKKYGVKVIINKEDMQKMLSISDIYITEFSTTILEAFLLRKPIILTNFERFYKYESYPEFKGIVWHAYNQKDIEKAVKYILDNKPGKKEETFRRAIIRKNLYKEDGKATERIIQLINRLKLKN